LRQRYSSRTRLILSAILSVCICTLSFAGETAFTKITKTNIAGGWVQIDAEGTNELDAKEELETWTPKFIRPDGKDAIASIVQYNAPKAGGGTAVFKIRFTATDPNGKDKGDWKGYSTLDFLTAAGGAGQSTAPSDKVTLP
jgi:hypothetical protein